MEHYQKVDMLQDIGIVVNQVKLGLVMLELEMKHLNAKMNILADKNSKNLCESEGISTTCLSQVPFTIDG